MRVPAHDLQKKQILQRPQKTSTCCIFFTVVLVVSGMLLQAIKMCKQTGEVNTIFVKVATPNAANRPSFESTCRSRLATMALPESTILSPNCSKPCVTAFGHKDGLGAQLGHIFAAIMWAKATGREFVHTKLTQLAHLQDYVTQEHCPMLSSHEARDGVTYLNCDPRGESVAACNSCVEAARVDLEQFLGLRVPTSAAAQETCENVPFDAAMKVGLIASKIEGVGHRNANCEVRKSFRNFYNPDDPDKKQIELDLDYSDASVDVAIHIRKGDAMKYRNRLNLSQKDIILGFQTHVLNKLKDVAQGRLVCIHIYSEGKPSWFESTCDQLKTDALQAGIQLGCRDVNNDCIAHINTDLKHTFHGMVAADVLVVGGSSLSRTAGLLNIGLVLDRVFMDKASALGVVNYHQVYEHRRNNGLRKVDGILFDPSLQDACVLEREIAPQPAPSTPLVDSSWQSSSEEIEALRQSIASVQGLTLNEKGRAKLVAAQARLALLQSSGHPQASTTSFGSMARANKSPEPTKLRIPVNYTSSVVNHEPSAIGITPMRDMEEEIRVLRHSISTAQGLRLNTKGTEKLMAAKSRLAALESEFAASQVFAPTFSESGANHVTKDTVSNDLDASSSANLVSLT
eukprot:SAG31_NODE_143_length_22627_cov_14.541347_10_plen_628_part_00